MFMLRSLVTTIGLVLVVLILLPRTEAQQKLESKVESKPNIAAFDDAERTVQQIAVLGPKLVKVVEDPKASFSDRFQAAQLLGKLKYQPGIGVLIRHIGLFDRFALTSDGPEFKCIAALTEYGDAAVPAVIDAYLVVSEDDQTQEHLLLSIVSTGKRGAVALPYCKGLAPVKPEPAFDKKLRLLMNYLKD